MITPLGQKRYFPFYLPALVRYKPDDKSLPIYHTFCEVKLSHKCLSRSNLHRSSWPIEVTLRKINWFTSFGRDNLIIMRYPPLGIIRDRRLIYVSRSILMMQTLTISNTCRRMHFARTCFMISCPAFIRYIIKGILHFSHIQYYKTTYLSKNTC